MRIASYSVRIDIKNQYGTKDWFAKVESQDEDLRFYRLRNFYLEFIMYGAVSDLS